METMSTRCLSSDKATCRTDLGIGNIISRTLTEVGKELWPHEDHEDDEYEMPVNRQDDL